MAKTFKPKIIWIFYRIECDVLVFFQRFLNILLFFSASVVFFGEYVENVKAFAQGEELKKCGDVLYKKNQYWYVNQRYG